MNNAGDGDSLPLAGQRVLVTRAPHQASDLADRLRALGATPVLIPTIEIGPPGSFEALDAAVASLASFDLVAFTSANAVRAFEERTTAIGVAPTPRQIAVVGSATARAVEALGLRVDVVPQVFTAESLGQTLLPEVRGLQILLVLAEDAPAILETVLRGGGAEVTVAAAYKNRIPETSLSAVIDLFVKPEAYPNAATFTSASTAKNLVALLEAAGLTLPDAVVRASIGPITSRTMVGLGLPPHIEAEEPTIAALVEAVVTCLRSPTI